MNSMDRQITIGDLTLDLERQTVTRGQNRLDLAGLSFRLLRVLADRWPAAVSRRELLQEVWGDVVVSDDALRQRIRLLRQSLGKTDYIAAEKGFGYRLTLPVKAGNPFRRRQILFVAAAGAAVVFIAYGVFGTDFELLHAVRHAIRH